MGVAMVAVILAMIGRVGVGAGVAVGMGQPAAVAVAISTEVFVGQLLAHVFKATEVGSVRMAAPY